MGKVLIIKDNGSVKDIYKYALESFNKGEGRYYNSKIGSVNEKYLSHSKKDFGEDGILLMITYSGESEEQIQDIFIGDEAKINENNNVEYIMRRHLTKDKSENAIDSIIDKIDLELSKDFAPKCYVMVCEMESLYNELSERIKSAKNQGINKTNPFKDTKINYKKDEEERNFKLDKLAQKECQIIRVYASDNVGENRTEFQRDRERVVNCKAFRRMVDKAQIFGAEKGDYYRTRMTHTLEVNQIAKAIAYALKLNLDLTEAIALGHDIGHTPFGHQGERTLDDILCGKLNAGIAISQEMLNKRCFGGFKHNYQSARILTQLEEKYESHPGLNVSVQVVEGVLMHTRLKREIDIYDFLTQSYLDKMKSDSDCSCSATLEGQTVAIADEIAQRGHDVDDALTSGVITMEEFIDYLKIGKCDSLRRKIQSELDGVHKSRRLIPDENELLVARVVSAIINYMILDVITFSSKQMKENNSSQISMYNEIKVIGFSEETESLNSYLEKVIQKKVICNSEVARADYNGSIIVHTLFKKYYSNPRLLHKGTLHKIFIETLNHKDLDVSNSAVNLNDGSIRTINKEIEEITKTEISEDSCNQVLSGRAIQNVDDRIRFEKRKILVRCIVDYIAGMTDGYALQEFEKLK